MDRVRECCEFDEATSRISNTDELSYYVLVVLCVFGKKADWIKNACLAAVLLFPAVAALHGITLAALHVDGELEAIILQ
jgi:hypothetical protein